MQMYNLIEYSDNYLKSSGSLWQYCKDIPAVNNGNIVDFGENNLTDSFNFTVKMTGQTGDNGTKGVEIMVPLKYLSNFWRTLEIPLINCEINLILTWSANCVMVSTDVENQGAAFPISSTKLYVLVVTLSTKDNTKLLQQLKSGFKRTMNWNKYQSTAKLLAQNQYLDQSILPNFQGVNRLFVLSFENDAQRISNKRYDLPNIEIKDYNVMTDGKNFFDKPVKNDKITYENIRKIAPGQGDDYTIGCLLDYHHFRDNYKMIATDLSKQQALDADPRVTQQINFTATLDHAGNTNVFYS